MPLVIVKRNRSDGAHVAGFERFRAARVARRAQGAEEPRPAILRSAFGSTLTERQITHRRRMLEFALTTRSRAAHR
jgi:hypothetical protein